MIRVGIYSSSRLFGSTLRLALRHEHVRLIEPADEQSLVQFIRIIGQERPNIMVIDLAGASAKGLELHRGARMFGSFKSIALNSKADSEADFNLSIKSDSDISELIAAIHQLASGMGPLIIREKRTPGHQEENEHGLPLSSRQYEAACLIAKGFSNQQIAETMSLKEQTVKNLVSKIIDILGCQNRIEVAVRLAAAKPAE